MRSRKNQGGRPKGSYAHDFRKELAEVADILVRDPKRSPRDVMMKILDRKPGPHSSQDKGLRTMQRRWEHQSKELLAEARERRDERFYNTRAVSTSKSRPYRASDLMEGLNPHGISAALRAADFASSVVQGLNIGQVGKIVEEVNKTSDIIRATMDSPTMQMIRKIQEDQERMSDIVDPMWRYR